VVIKLGRSQELLRAVAANLVDGDVVDLLLHIAGRGILLNGGPDGRNLVGCAAGGVHEKNGQRADRDLAVKNNFIDRETAMTDKKRLRSKVNGHTLAVKAKKLQAY